MEESRGSVSNYMGPSFPNENDTAARSRIASQLAEILAARTRRVIPVPEAVRPASVLVPLFRGDDGEVRVWLLRKLGTLRKHAGQVALPGGKREPDDATLLDTALREAREEIGLDPAIVDVLGPLDDVFTFTGYVITPYVGWLRAPLAPEPDPNEVARVFSAPLATFATEGVEHELDIRGTKKKLPGYDLDGELLWGATYMILRGMMLLLERTD